MSARLEDVDILRGFAVLFIAFSNVPLILTSAQYTQTSSFLAQDGSGSDLLVWLWLTFVPSGLTGVLYFATIMGIGLGLESRRARTPADTRTATAARATALALLGLAHGLLVWWGDVLFAYGVVLLVATRWLGAPTTRRVAVAAIAALVPVWLLLVDIAARLPSVGDRAASALRVSMGQNASARADATRAYRSGSVADVLHQRAGEWFNYNLDLLLFGGPLLLGAVLMGFELGRSRVASVLARIESGPRLALASGLLSFALLSCYTLGTFALSSGVSAAVSALEILRLAAIAPMLLMLTFLFLRAGRIDAVRRVVGQVGRLSLSVYIGISMVCAFMGYGLRLFDRLGFGLLLALALLLNAGALVVAARWPASRIGPVEAVLRRLSRLHFDRDRTGAVRPTS